MTKILDNLHAIVWGAPALILIIGVGMFLTVRTRFCQLWLLPKALAQFVRQLRASGKDGEDNSGYRALCTALAATVGTGNIAGVAGAICIGGPGAVFWMWLCGILGMVIKYAEATLAVRFRQKNSAGEWVGGPMYFVRLGLGRRWDWLGKLYCVFGVIAAFGVGNATQINAVVTSLEGAMDSAGINMGTSFRLVIGAVLAVVVFLMLQGGARRIGQAAEQLVPAASVVYILLCAAVLIVNHARMDDALLSIISGAFHPRAVTAGVIGSAFSALRVGLSRGVFTNEAGMGTAAIAHASSNAKHPAQQGLMGIMEVFLDTIVICTMTAFAILTSGIPIPYGMDTGAELTAAAFSGVFGQWAAFLLSGTLCCFAFATILGWGLYGIRCAEFLFGRSCSNGFAAVQGTVVFLSTLLNTGTIWTVCETVNGLMVIPNLIALAALTPEVVRLTNEYKHWRDRKAVAANVS